MFLSSRKYDPACSSQIRIPNPDPDIYPSRLPGSKSTGFRIQIRNTVIRGGAVYRTVILLHNVATGQDSPFPLNAGIKCCGSVCFWASWIRIRSFYQHHQAK